MKARTLFVTAWLLTAFVAAGCSDKGARPAASSAGGKETASAKATPPQPIPAHVDDAPDSTEPSPADTSPPASNAWSPPVDAPVAPPPPVVAETLSDAPAEAPNAIPSPPSASSDEPVADAPAAEAPAPSTEAPAAETPLPPPTLSDLPFPGTAPAPELSAEPGNPLRRSEPAPSAPRPRIALGGNPLRSPRSSFAPGGSVPMVPPAPAAMPRIPRLPTSAPSRIPSEPQDNRNVPLPAAPESDSPPAEMAAPEPSGGAAPPAEFTPSDPSGGFVPPFPMPPPPPIRMPAGAASPSDESAALEPTEPPTLDASVDSAEEAPRELTPEEEAATPMPRVMSPTARQPQLGPGDAARDSLADDGPVDGQVDAPIDDGFASSDPDAPAEAMGLLGDGKPTQGADANDGKSKDPFTVVKVFYGTDRIPIALGAAADAKRSAALLPLFIIITLIVALAASAFVYRRWQRTWVALATAVVVVVICTAVASPFSLWKALGGAGNVGPIAYGNGRGELDYGEVEITIPKVHKVGQVERPTILRLELQERSDKHVVIRRIDRLEQAKFFESVKKRVVNSPREDLFVFIHGYNVSFEMAARRTAQMAHDLQFEGAPIFYSWPSQGGLLQYPVDENNVAWTVPHLKQFLRDVIEQTDAKAVNIIAHSMGNRALAAAVRELSLEKSISEKQFNQIVLAAPDIDAEVFKRDIAPVLTQTAQHVTLYASSRDQALVASKLVHGYPRAGDSGSNLLVVPGVETIDVSDVDTGILGHSYYGNSMPILRDLNLILRASQAAAGRPWLEQAQHDGLGYWVFEPKSLANREAGARR
ncbi:MAG: alpha/beta hydrolase [Pirellulales bacterium]